jgi:hypothetical protein
LLLTACGYFSNWVTEQRSPGTRGDRFTTITLLVGSSDQASLVLAERVEQRLTEAGRSVVTRGGRWGTEAEALREICPIGQSLTADGVLFVWLDRFRLWDCKTHAAAYEVRSEQAGADELLSRLLRYLRSEPPP